MHLFLEFMCSKKQLLLWYKNNGKNGINKLVIGVILNGKSSKYLIIGYFGKCRKENTNGKI